MASAGFEPANLGTKGQHATPRPPKQHRNITAAKIQIYEYIFFSQTILTSNYSNRSYNFENSVIKCHLRAPNGVTTSLLPHVTPEASSRLKATHYE
jgi:hypothetical protein